MKKRNVFISIPEGIEELKKGNMLIVVDSIDRENQADVIFPAETATTDKVNFLIKECRGMVCVPITKERAQKLNLHLMVPLTENTEKLKCKFTITVDAKDVASFGISARDRALTIRTLAKENTKASDLVRPGHVFPIIAEDGGILARDGHTEATIELITRAGFSSTGVLCEVLQENGKVARGSNLTKFAKKFNLKIVTISDLIEYVKSHPLKKFAKISSVVKKASSLLPTRYGTFRIAIYQSLLNNCEHVVLSMGDMSHESVMTRIHSQCLTGDTLFSLKCDCGEQLQKSMQRIQRAGRGIILYLNQEGRGIGLVNKIKAYALQEKGFDTVSANEQLGFPKDARDYEVAAEILHDLGVKNITLLTNNPAKEKQLSLHGIHISKIISLEVKPNLVNRRYLKTKKQKLGHRLSLV